MGKRKIVKDDRWKKNERDGTKTSSRRVASRRVASRRIASYRTDATRVRADENTRA